MIKSVSKYIIIIHGVLLLINNSFAGETSKNNFLNSSNVTIGGFIDSNIGARGESVDYRSKFLPDTVLNSSAFPGTHNRMNNPDFSNNSQIRIKAESKSNLGMKYGALVQVESNVNSDTVNQSLNASRAYIFSESNFGKFEFGNNIGANQKMKVGPSNFARAAGGINGKYLEYINLPMLADSSGDGVTAIGNCAGYRVNNSGMVNDTSINNSLSSNCSNIKLPRFILIPTSPISHGGYGKSFYNRVGGNDYNNVSHDDGSFNNKKLTQDIIHDGSFGQLENATKISYYLPRISGWQAGLTFTPDTGNSSASNNNDDIKNVVSWGINYSDNFDNLGFAVSLTGENGKFKQNKTAMQRNDLQSYEIGAMGTFFGFTFGGSYGSWGKSLEPKSGIYSCDYNSNISIANQNCLGANAGKKFSNADYWTAGLAYQFGPAAASITHINSKFQSNNYDATSFGIDYKMVKGLMPYIEITRFKFKSNRSVALDVNQSSLTSSQRQIKDNDGYVALAGVLFAF